MARLNPGALLTSHSCYASQKSIQPVSLLRYRLGELLAPALGWFRLRDRFVGPKAEGFGDTESLLWFGYRGTNSVFPEDVVLVSEQGLRLPLAPGVEDTLTARSPPEHLISWELPSQVTNRGKYRLTLPSRNQTLLTFIYE